MASQDGGVRAGVGGRFVRGQNKTNKKKERRRKGKCQKRKEERQAKVGSALERREAPE